MRHAPALLSGRKISISALLMDTAHLARSPSTTIVSVGPGAASFTKDERDLSGVNAFVNGTEAEASSYLPIGCWTVLTMTYDGTAPSDNLRLYINGKQVSAQNCAAPLKQGGGLVLIGGDEKRLYHGLIQKVEIYHDALSPEQVRGLDVQQKRDRKPPLHFVTLLAAALLLSGIMIAVKLMKNEAVHNG